MHCTVGVLVCFSVPVPLERVVCVYPRSFFFYRSIRSTILSFSLFFLFLELASGYIILGAVGFLFYFGTYGGSNLATFFKLIIFYLCNNMGPSPNSRH